METIIDRKLGWKRELPDQRDFKYALHRDMQQAISIPAHTDLRNSLSPIEDQGQLGSCVAHGTAACLEFLELQEIKENLTESEYTEYFSTKFTPVSRLFTYWNARAIDGTTDQDEGTQIRSAILSFRNTGICREPLWPYDPSQVFTKPEAAAFNEAKAHHVLFAYKIDNTQISQWKQCLALGYPIVFGISVYDSFMSAKVAQSGIIPMPGRLESMQGGHCMAVVGHDDATRSFLIRNSWGTGWGLVGYAHIPYAYLTSSDLCSDVWTLRKVATSS